MAEHEADIFTASGIGMAVVECDVVFTIKRCNPAFERLMGYEGTSFPQTSLSRILAPGGFSALAAAFPPEPPDQPIQFETAIQTSAGKYRYVHLSVSTYEAAALCCFTDIDSRKNRELEMTKKLAEDEMRFNQSKILTGIFRVATRELILSHRAAEMFGVPRLSKDYPYNSIIGESNTIKAKQFISFFEKIVAGEPSGKASTVLQLGDGSSRLFNFRFKTVFNPDGSPSHGVISMIDITVDRERLLASEKWKVTNESFKSDYIHYYDYNLTIDALETIEGSNPSVYPAQNERTFTGVAKYMSKNIVHPDDRVEYNRAFDRQALLEKYDRGEHRVTIEHRRLKPDGTYMRAQGIIQLSRDPFNGDILCLVLINDLDAAMGLIRDRMTNEIYNLVTDTIPGAIILTMHEENYPYYHLNDGVYTLTNCPEDQFDAWSGGFTINIVHPDDRQTVINIMEDAIAQNTTFDCKCRILKYDGSIGWVMLRGKKGLAPEGHEVIHSVLVDITEIVSLQDALHDAVANAQAANKTKTVFLANMSHEIRTPMNGIIGLSEILLGDPSLPQKTANFIHQIHSSAVSLLDIINDILDISKIEAGKMELENIDFTLRPLIMECEALYSYKAEEKGIALQLVIDSCADAVVRGDPTKLRQVLRNLLSNAVKFTDRGRVLLSIKSMPEVDGKRMMRFTVSDTGIGMTETQLHRIFDPFIQADSSTTRRYGGTGLGLSITKNIIGLMGGKLVVTSKQGEGSCFSFDIGFEAGIDDSFVLTAPTNAPRMIPTFSGDVLVCEDNSINQQVIFEHLSRVGLKAVLADNGRVGVELAQERMVANNPFKLVFMDIHMPELDGVDATAELKRLGINTPIIALTANAMTWERDNYLEAGMSDYIAKPFESGELWECLLRHLEPLSMSPVQTPELRLQHSSSPSGTASIRKELGLQRAAGNAALYTRLKHDFAQNNRNTFARLSSAIDDGDRVLAHRIVHSLKSSAAQIGAISLAESANTVEGILSENKGEKEAELKKGLFDLDNALREALRELAPTTMTTSQRKARAKKYTMERSAILTFLARLEPLLTSGDSDSVQFLPAVQDILAPLGPLAVRLYDEMDAFDFDLAVNTIHEIRNELGVDA